MLNLQEQVYQWETVEDIWAGLKDARLTGALREQLFNGFSPDKSPNERSFEKFDMLLQTLKKAAVESSWTDCVQVDEAENVFRANNLLVLLGHFEWVYSIFATLPGASVVVR